MKTIIPQPRRPFTDEELKMLIERLEFIETALDEGKIVVATRPSQITGNLTNKVLHEIKFHPDTDADLVTVTGGAMNLLDETYKMKSYKPEELPNDISEGLCLAHIYKP